MEYSEHYIKHKKKTREEWIQLFRIKHDSKYTYEKFLPGKPTENVILTCPIHGDFLMRANMHSAGRGCQKCSAKKYGKQVLKTKEEWMIEFLNIHGNTYDYSKSEIINGDTKFIVICKKHGEFITKPSYHRTGRGCPKCKMPKGEIAIKIILENYNVKYTQQKKFVECKDKNQLSFDFYLDNYNILIEYQGQQHFCGTGYNKIDRNLDYYKNHDKIKREFCKTNNISLYEILYNENIKEKMDYLIHNILGIARS